MKQIGNGVYVQDFDDHRSYLIEAEFSPHIESIKSYENATQEIAIRASSEAEAQPITEFIKLKILTPATAKIM